MTASLDMKRTLLWNRWMTPPSLSGIQTTMKILFRRESALHHGAQGTTYCSASTKPRSWSMILWKKKSKDTHCLHHGAEVKQVDSFRFLGITITEKLSWTSYIIIIYTLVKKAQKWLNCLRELRKATFPCQTLVNFYREAIESILTGNITIWHGTCMDRRALQRVIKCS